MKILVAGGGTAGHISPVLAVIDSIQKLRPDAEILFVCSGTPQEVGLLENSGIDYKFIPSGKYRRYGRGLWHELRDIKTQFSNISDLFKIAGGYRKARKIMSDFKPDVVFIKGGYVGLPVGLAAYHIGIPYVIHESDSVLGKTNQILSKNAAAVAVSFPEESYKPNNKRSSIVVTGNPVRSEYGNALSAKTNKPSDDRANLLIFAGSQGAKSINSVVFNNIELFLNYFNLTHITGHRDIEEARTVKHRLPIDFKKRYQPHSFLGDAMLGTYTWADIIVARAGMNSLSEIAALSKPAIIIPLDSSTNDHQMKNAEYLYKQGAIILIQQKDLSAIKLVEQANNLISNSSRRKYLSSTIHKFYKPKASEDIAKLIIEVSGKNKLNNEK